MEEEYNGDPGTCGFCGAGGGYLGEQGDDLSQRLHSAVRTGSSPDTYKYKTHPNAYNQNYVMWCGQCVGGLKHKFQRYSDTNLNALIASYQLRLEMDGVRWAGWEFKEARKYGDDPAIHLDKLHIMRDLEDARNERLRRYGHDLTRKGFRP
jgi:hypothetical protein